MPWSPLGRAHVRIAGRTDLRFHRLRTGVDELDSGPQDRIRFSIMIVAVWVWVEVQGSEARGLVETSSGRRMPFGKVDRMACGVELDTWWRVRGRRWRQRKARARF